MTDIMHRDTNITTGNPDDFHACHGCGQQTHIDLLDAKPDDPTDPDGCDWTRLECRSCYGPGWAPALESQWPPVERHVRRIAYALRMARSSARIRVRRTIKTLRSRLAA